MEDLSARARRDSAKSKPSFAVPFALAPFCPFPLPRRARAAPKLILRANGVAGTLAEGLLALGEVLSSSNGDSSTEPEFADEILSARLRMLLKGEVWAPGRVERPRVVIERRRGGWPCEETEERGLNMSTKEDRRRFGAGGDSRGLFWSEEDILVSDCYADLADNVDVQVSGVGELMQCT